MEYFFGFVILLGVLIFIHEFGHFIVAKACGVRVETFSIGMGKKLFSFTRGDTTYALSILPLGGYVKLTGQDPREEVTPELEAVSFRHKPLSYRSAIVLAGPLFNAALAIILFVILYMVGIQKPAAVMSRVLPDSPAAQAGFQNGDIVSEIENTATKTKHKIREYADLEEVVGSSVGQSLVFTVNRKTPNSDQTTTQSFSYSPVLGLDRDSNLGIFRERGIIEGVERDAPAPVLAIKDPQSWAALRKVEPGFYVEELTYSQEGVEKTLKIENFFDLQKGWQESVHAQQNSISGQIKLKGQVINLDKTPAAASANKTAEDVKPVTHLLTWTTKADRPSEKIEETGFVSSELLIVEVVKDSPAEKLGLKPGDLMETLDGKPVLSFASFRKQIQDVAKTGRALKMTWYRDGKLMSADALPREVTTTDPLTEVKKNQFQVGAAFMALPAPTILSDVKASGFFEAISMGTHSTVTTTQHMLASFYHLAVGNISPKTLGGPILIGKVAGESFKKGITPFLKMMAFISLNLFILNLLPVPVLDGGHLVLFMIEAIRRKPLGIRVIEMWTTAGFVLLMGLIAVVFFNDLSRLGIFKFLSS